MNSHYMTGYMMTTTTRPKKAYKGPAMEGFIADWYAKSTRGGGRHVASAETLGASLQIGRASSRERV